MESQVLVAATAKLPLPDHFNLREIAQAANAHAKELSEAADQLKVNIEGLKIEELKKYAAPHQGADAAKHYAKGLTDALLAMRRVIAASTAYKFWRVKLENESRAAANAATAAAGGAQ